MNRVSIYSAKCVAATTSNLFMLLRIKCVQKYEVNTYTDRYIYLAPVTLCANTPRNLNINIRN